MLSGLNHNHLAGSCGLWRLFFNNLHRSGNSFRLHTKCVCVAVCINSSLSGWGCFKSKLVQHLNNTAHGKQPLNQMLVRSFQEMTRESDLFSCLRQTLRTTHLRLFTDAASFPGGVVLTERSKPTRAYGRRCPFLCLYAQAGGWNSVEIVWWMMIEADTMMMQHPHTERRGTHTIVFLKRWNPPQRNFTCKRTFFQKFGYCIQT